MEEILRVEHLHKKYDDLGVLEALGYSRGTVMSKYLFYAGSASLLGCDIDRPRNLAKSVTVE